MVDGVAARFGGRRLALQDSLRALVAHRRAAGEGDQAGVLTAGRREHWEAGRERTRSLKVAGLKVARLSAVFNQGPTKRHPSVLAASLLAGVWGGGKARSEPLLHFFRIKANHIYNAFA